MAYKVIILYRLYMPPYFLGTFTEYLYIKCFVLLCKTPKPFFLSGKTSGISVEQIVYQAILISPRSLATIRRKRR